MNQVDVQAEVTRISNKMKGLDPTSEIYRTYQEMLDSLNPRAVKLHVEVGPTCEGCQ